MPDNYILPDNELIDKFLKENNLEFYYSKPVLKHIKEFMLASIEKGFSAKTTDIVEHSENHRTTIGHFLSNGVWNEEYLKRIIKKAVLDFMLSYSKENNEPIYIINDDTVAKKTKPSSQAKSPIQDTGFHYSNLHGKTVWGHQILATMIQCGEHSLIYDLQQYDKDNKSKIDAVRDLAETMPTPPNKSYALFDSMLNDDQLRYFLGKKNLY